MALFVVDCPACDQRSFVTAQAPGPGRPAPREPQACSLCGSYRATVHAVPLESYERYLQGCWAVNALPTTREGWLAWREDERREDEALAAEARREAEA